MCKDLILGFAVGMAIGLMVKRGKGGVDGMIEKTKDVVRKKLKDVAESI